MDWDKGPQYVSGGGSIRLICLSKKTQIRVGQPNIGSGCPVDNLTMLAIIMIITEKNQNATMVH